MLVVDGWGKNEAMGAVHRGGCPEIQVERVKRAALVEGRGGLEL